MTRKRVTKRKAAVKRSVKRTVQVTVTKRTGSARASGGPGSAALSAALGSAQPLWDDFVERIRREHPAAQATWKRYSVGWRLVFDDGKRNIAYLKPASERFLVSFALNDEALGAAERSKLPRSILDPIRASKKLPEGRAARIEVGSARDVGHAAMLFAIKIAH